MYIHRNRTLGTVPISAGATLINVASTAGTSMVTSAIAPAAATATAGIGASLATAGVTAGLSLAVAGLTMWLQSAKLRGKQKVAATTIANQVEGKLKELQDAYNASGKTYADYVAAKEIQTQLLDYFQSSQGCGNPDLAAAGQRCLSERMCKDGCLYPWLSWYDLGPVPPRPEGQVSNAALSNIVNTIGQSVGSGGNGSLLLIAAAGLLLYGMTR